MNEYTRHKTPAKRRRAIFSALVLLAIISGCYLLPVHAQENGGYGKSSLDELFDALSEYEYGKDPDLVVELEARVIDAANTPEPRKNLPQKVLDPLFPDKPAQRDEIEERLLSVLDSGAPYAARLLAAKQLYVIGTDKSVPTLARLLTGDDQTIGEAALYALQRNESAEAARALRTSLDSLEGSRLIGVIDAVGERRDRQAVSELSDLLSAPHEEVRAAAIAALGAIGTRACAEELMGGEFPLSLREPVADSLLQCARQMNEDGETEDALSVYRSLYRPHEPTHVRVGAFEGLLETDPAGAPERVLDAFGGDDSALQAQAALWIRSSENGEEIDGLASQMPSMNDTAQLILLGALADGRSRAGLEAVIDRVQEAGSVEVQIAALQALGALGDRSSVALLLSVASSSDAALQGPAREALSDLEGEGINEALAASAQSLDPASRVEAIRALEDRRAVEAQEDLLELASSRDPDVRAAAWRALARLGGEPVYEGAIGLLAGAEDDSDRQMAGRAVEAIALRVAEEQRPEPLLSAYRGLKSPDAQVAFLDVMGRVASQRFLPVLEAAVQGEDERVRAAAIRALHEWPTAEPMDMLKRIAAETDDPSNKAYALRGFIRMAGMPSPRSEEETLALYEQAMALADRVEEKRLVLSALAASPSPAALELVNRYADDEALSAEVQQAAKTIREALDEGWNVSASDNSRRADRAIDGDQGTRWDTGRTQRGDQWFQLDLGWVQTISGLTLDSSDSPRDYPREYRIRMSTDGEDWTDPVVEGSGAEPVTEIHFTPRRTRFIRIEQTGESDDSYWSIHELTVDGG